MNLGAAGADDVVDRVLYHAQKPQAGLGMETLAAFSLPGSLTVTLAIGRIGSVTAGAGSAGMAVARKRSSLLRSRGKVPPHFLSNRPSAVVEERQQEVLEPRELMSPARRVTERLANRLLQLRA